MIRGFPFPYQQSADPIQPDPALLKWRPEDNQPPKGKAFFLAAVLAGAVFVGEPIAPPAETITLDKWYQPLSEPARPVPALHAALQQAVTTDPEALTQPEDVKVTSWLNPLAEPQPAPRLVPEGAFGYVRDVETPDVTWLRRLDEPVLPTPPVAYQQDFAIDAEALTQPEDPKLKWYTSLSEPYLVQGRAVDFPQPGLVTNILADVTGDVAQTTGVITQTLAGRSDITGDVVQTMGGVFQSVSVTVTAAGLEANITQTIGAISQSASGFKIGPATGSTLVVPIDEGTLSIRGLKILKKDDDRTAEVIDLKDTTT